LFGKIKSRVLEKAARDISGGSRNFEREENKPII